MTLFILVLQKIDIQTDEYEYDEYECSGYSSPPNIIVLNYILKMSLNVMFRL